MVSVLKQVRKLNDTFDKLTFRSIETEFLTTLRVYNKAWQPPMATDQCCDELRKLNNTTDDIRYEHQKTNSYLYTLVDDVRSVNVWLSKVERRIAALETLFCERLLVQRAPDTGNTECLRVYNRRR